jgi:hypothetical protein
MDRTAILNLLAQATRHVAEAEGLMALQREIVAKRGRDGHNASAAKQLLDQLEQLYAMQVADRDCLEKELVEASS